MLINAYENRGHQRFTMAHEFGHYIFEYDGKSDFADEYSLDKERLKSYSLGCKSFFLIW